MKFPSFLLRSNRCVLSAVILACASFAAAANPATAPARVIVSPNHPVRSIVDIELEQLDLTSSSGGGTFARPQIRNASKTAVNVLIEATLERTGKLDVIANHKPLKVVERKTIPAQTQLSADLLLPLNTCAGVTVKVTPEKNVIDLNMSNNTKSIMLPCPK